MTDDIGLTAITVYLFWDTAQSNAKCLASFIPAISIAPLQSSTTQRRSRLQHGYCIEVSRRSSQATVGEGLAQGPYVTARAGVEPTTLRLKVIDSTNAPSRPTIMDASLNKRINPRATLMILVITCPAVFELKLPLQHDQGLN